MSFILNPFYFLSTIIIIFIHNVKQKNIFLKNFKICAILNSTIKDVKYLLFNIKYKRRMIQDEKNTAYYLNVYGIYDWVWKGKGT